MSFVEIRVLETRGSAPREAGTRMWVGETEVRGTIGGGNPEYTALKIAREMLLAGETRGAPRISAGSEGQLESRGSSEFPRCPWVRLAERGSRGSKRLVTAPPPAEVGRECFYLLSGASNF